MEEKITCPLIDSLISPVDCMENQDLKEKTFLKSLRKKKIRKKFVKIANTKNISK